MDWLKMFSLLFVLFFFDGEVMAGTRKKIRIHIPQKVKYIHHHKKIYITKYPTPTGVESLQHYGITNGQYAPQFASSSAPIPIAVLPLSEKRISSLAPNIQPLYRARGHYGPPPVYTKTKRATKLRPSDKRVKVIKVSQVRRKRVPRKKHNKKSRNTKKYNDKENSHRDSNYHRESHHDEFHDTPYEMSEAHPTTFKTYKKPKRVEKYVDKDGEHIHTYTEEHIHQYVYDEPAMRNPQVEGYNYNQRPAFYTKNGGQTSPVVPFNIAIQEAYQAGNPAASSIVSATISNMGSVLHASPSPMSYPLGSSNHPALSPINKQILSSTSQPIIAAAFPPMHPSTMTRLPIETQYFGFNPMGEGLGSMGTPAFMEYMDYDPNDATYDHMIHNHGEITNVDYSGSDDYGSSSNMFKNNPFLNNLYGEDKPKSPWKSQKTNWHSMSFNPSAAGASTEDLFYSLGGDDYYNDEKHSSSTKTVVHKHKDKDSSETYSTATTTKKPFDRNPRFRPKQKQHSKVPPTSIASYLEDNPENIRKQKNRSKPHTSGASTTTPSLPNEFKGVFDNTLYKEKLRGQNSFDGLSSSTFANDNSFRGTKSHIRENNQPQSSYRPVLKDSYGHSIAEELDYEFGHASNNKQRFTDPLESSSSNRGVRTKNKGQSVSSQTISFGGQDHTTVVDHFGERSNGPPSLDISSREGGNDDVIVSDTSLITAPSGREYDNAILNNRFDQPSPTINTDGINFNIVEAPKLSDLVFTERSFNFETTTLAHSTPTEQPRLTTKSTLRPTRKYKTSSTNGSKLRSRTKHSRSKATKHDGSETTTQLSSHTTYIPERGNLRYGDKVVE